MSSYNLTVVVDGEATPAKRKTVKEGLEKLVASVKGKLTKTDELGVKDLAYKIKKAKTGYFLNLNVNLDGEGAKGVLSKLQHDDNLLRYLLVRKDEVKEKKGKKKANGKKS